MFLCVHYFVSEIWLLFAAAAIAATTNSTIKQ